MKKLLITSLALLVGSMTYALSVVVSVAAKSPVILYKNLSEIVNQLPPNAAQAKMMAAMGFASIGAPNFDGVDPNANIGFCMFDDGTELFILNASDNAMLYQMAAASSTVKRSGNWVVLTDKLQGEISDEKAKLAIEAVQANLDADLVAKIYPGNFEKLMPADFPANIKAFFKDEFDLATYKLSLNSKDLKLDLAMNVKSGSCFEKIFKSLKKADEVQESKFASKDNLITFVSSSVLTQDTIAGVSELFEKYFKADKALLESLKKLPPNAGTSAGYMKFGTEMNFVSFSKSQMTPAQYVEQVELASKLLFEILKSMMPKELQEEAFQGIAFPDKSESEIDSVKVISFNLQEANYDLASTDGIFIITYQASLLEDSLDNNKKLISDSIKLVKSGQAVANPLPSKIDDDVLVMLDLSKIEDELTREIFASFAPIAIKGNIDDTKLSFAVTLPTSDIVNAIAKGFEMQARAMQQQMQVNQVPVQQEDIEASEQK